MFGGNGGVWCREFSQTGKSRRNALRCSNHSLASGIDSVLDGGAQGRNGMTFLKDINDPTISAVGVSGFLVSFSDVLTEEANSAAIAWAQQVQSDPIEGVLETAPSLVSVVLRYDPVLTDPEDLRSRIEARLTARTAGQDAPRPRRRWTIPCVFDGPQLSEVARQIGKTEAEAVASIEAQTTRVLALGFAPGQPYLGLLDESWTLDRMAGIAPTVPKGALVTAVRQLITFAGAAPTGWWHIGNTAFNSFDQRRGDQAIAYLPGDEVRFTSVSQGEIETLRQAADGLGGATLDRLT